MKRLGMLVLALTAGWAWAQAAPVALVYENETAAAAGKSTVGTVVDGGVLIPATLAMSSGNNLYVGLAGGKLHKAVLARLDNDLNLAVVRFGEEAKASLQAVHQARSAAYSGFVPAASADAAGASIPVASLIAASTQGVSQILVSSGPFLVKINGVQPSNDPIQLKVGVLKKSKFKMELVCVSTVPVWQFGVELRSSPKLAFWKVGRKTGLNDVPTEVFNYNQQNMFKPMKVGDFAEIPIEVYFIKDKDYEWTVKAFSKTEVTEQKIKIRFDSGK